MSETSKTSASDDWTWLKEYFPQSDWYWLREAFLQVALCALWYKVIHTIEVSEKREYSELEDGKKESDSTLVKAIRENVLTPFLFKTWNSLEIKKAAKEISADANITEMVILQRVQTLAQGFIASWRNLGKEKRPSADQLFKKNLNHLIEDNWIRPEDEQPCVMPKREDHDYQEPEPGTILKSWVNQALALDNWRKLEAWALISSTSSEEWLNECDAWLEALEARNEVDTGWDKAFWRFFAWLQNPYDYRLVEYSIGMVKRAYNKVDLPTWEQARNRIVGRLTETLPDDWPPGFLMRRCSLPVLKALKDRLEGLLLNSEITRHDALLCTLNEVVKESTQELVKKWPWTPSQTSQSMVEKIVPTSPAPIKSVPESAVAEQSPPTPSHRKKRPAGQTNNTSRQAMPSAKVSVGSRSQSAREIESTTFNRICHGALQDPAGAPAGTLQQCLERVKGCYPAIDLQDPSVVVYWPRNTNLSGQNLYVVPATEPGGTDPTQGYAVDRKSTIIFAQQPEQATCTVYLGKNWKGQQSANASYNIITDQEFHSKLMGGFQRFLKESFGHRDKINNWSDEQFRELLATLLDNLATLTKESTHQDKLKKLLQELNTFFKESVFALELIPGNLDCLGKLYSNLTDFEICEGKPVFDTSKPWGTVTEVVRFGLGRSGQQPFRKPMLRVAVGLDNGGQTALQKLETLLMESPQETVKRLKELIESCRSVLLKPANEFENSVRQLYIEFHDTNDRNQIAANVEELTTGLDRILEGLGLKRYEEKKSRTDYGQGHKEEVEVDGNPEGKWKKTIRPGWRRNDDTKPWVKAKARYE